MINAIPIVAENRIHDALERGEFDYLDGAGKPFADMDGSYDPNWWIRRKLQREQLTPEDARIVLEKLGRGGRR